MSIEDIVPVLQGFSSAYGKIANELGIAGQHRIRITGVRQGSASILLEVWQMLASSADALTSVSVLGGGAVTIVGGIIGVIRLKRHVKRRPFRERIGHANNTVEITSSENVTISMPITVFNIYKSKLIDQDISKIVQPLEQGRIDAAEIVVEDASYLDEMTRERIEAAERDLFVDESVPVTSSDPAWIVCRLNSLTKSTDSGYLHLSDGSRVFYKFVRQVPSELRHIFGTYDGPVRVFASAQLDENLKVIELNVLEIERVQGELFGHEEVGEDE
jgi:hypothetical protein